MLSWISLLPKELSETVYGNCWKWLMIVSKSDPYLDWIILVCMYGCLPPWVLFIKANPNKQSPLCPHVFKITPTCCIFWIFLSCSMRSRLAEFHNIQPISMISFGNKLMCSSFFYLFRLINSSPLQILSEWQFDVCQMMQGYEVKICSFFLREKT